jgi:hypothetical protein
VESGRELAKRIEGRRVGKSRRADGKAANGLGAGNRKELLESAFSIEDGRRIDLEDIDRIEARTDEVLERRVIGHADA